MSKGLIDDPSEHHGTMVSRGAFDWASIMPRGVSFSDSRCNFFQFGHARLNGTIYHATVAAIVCGNQKKLLQVGSIIVSDWFSPTVAYTQIDFFEILLINLKSDCIYHFPNQSENGK